MKAIKSITISMLITRRRLSNAKEMLSKRNLKSISEKKENVSGSHLISSELLLLLLMKRTTIRIFLFKQEQIVSWV